MGLNILGPIELESAGVPVRIGGPREHIVLSILALRANRVVPTDTLVDAVWGEHPPSTARGQIQGCISALRKLFADTDTSGVIRTHPAGYQLSIDAEDLDASRFARLYADARRQAGAGEQCVAARTLRTALDLWRGSALQGTTSEQVRRATEVLDGARLDAVEERLRLELALGHHDEIIGELRALVADHPLRERFVAYLALALYRAGRQAESLEVLRQARSTLADEVGIDPGQELQDLERDVLNRSPRLDPADTHPTDTLVPPPTHAVDPPRGPTSGTGVPELVQDLGRTSPPAAPPPASADVAELVDRMATNPRQLPRGAADFIGRSAQIKEITALLTEASGPADNHYAVPIIGIYGPGGVGKSTLALRVAHEVAQTYPDGHLYVDLQAAVEDRTTVLLARFLRALGVSGTAIPEDRDERAELCRSRLADKRMLIVFDGVVSESQIIPLLPGNPNCAVLVTSRTRLDFLDGAYWFGLDVFDPETSKRMLETIVGPERLAAEMDAADQLVSYAGGLPLALRIAGARLASRPHWRIAELTRRMKNEVRRLDEFSYRGLELRSSIGSSYRSLPDIAKRLFRLFALSQAPDFPGWTAAALLNVSLAEAEQTLELLVDVQLLDLVESPTGRARYRFHDLIRVFAQERLIATESEQDRLEALGRLFGAWLGLAERAHRSEYGGDYTTLHGAAARYRVADDEDDDVDTNPLDWLETERGTLVAAVRQAASVGLHEVCWDLALTLVSLFEVKGFYDDWRDTAEVALAAAERADDRLGCAASLYSLGTLNHAQKQLDDAERCFSAALELFRAEDIVHGVALVLRNAALIDRVRGNIPAMLAKFEESLRGMRAVGDLIGEANILRGFARLRIDEGDPESANRLLSEALELCRRAGYRRGTAQVESRIAEMYLATGETVAARQTLNRVLATVQEIGDRVGEAHALYWLGLVRLREGRVDTAESALANSREIASQTGEQMIAAQAEFALGGLRVARGDRAAAVEHLGRARDLFRRLGSALWLAKTLILLSDLGDEPALMAPLGRDLDEALDLLAGIDLKEAQRLRDQLAIIRANAADPTVTVGSSEPTN